FRTKLYRVRALHNGDVVQDLVVVLGVALRSVPLRANIQTENVDFGVGKVGKFRRDSVSLRKPRVRHAKIIDHVVTHCPGIREYDFATISAQSSGELCLWCLRIDPGLALTVVQKAGTNRVASQIQVAVDVEIVLIKVAG